MTQTFTPSTAAPSFLIFGSKGWIAGKLHEQLTTQGQTVNLSFARIEDREHVMRDLEQFKPTHVLNCAGQTGRPNVDWCEDNREATLRSNVIGTLNLIDCCFLKNIHVTNYATGCIYHYDAAHPIGGLTYTEECEPNFSASFYSKYKAVAEKVIREYPNVLTLRLRMPVSDDLNGRNFVTKIISYERVVDIPNSMTILYDLLPASTAMAGANLTGVYNFTNPGAISHNEVLTLYKKYIKPEFTWKNFTVDEQSKVIKAGRSNCELDTTKFIAACTKLGLVIPEIHAAYEGCFQRMAVNLKAAASHA